MHKVRNLKGYSLLETMAVIAVLGIVTGLLYAYSDQGWKLFNQSYSRGLSQVKAKLAIKVLSDELREANKNRLAVSKGSSFGVPLPDDTIERTPYIYFTKPISNKTTGDITGYNYILYYFAKPKSKDNEIENKNQRRKRAPEKEQYVILKYIKFLNQSKIYTEDSTKTWPFLPPILELRKSRLPEDEEYIKSLNQTNSDQSSQSSDTSQGITKTDQPSTNSNEVFLDHFAILKKESRTLPVSGNFLASSLTEPFTTDEVSIFFGQDYKSDKPVKIKVSIDEPILLFGSMGAKTEFEVKITPRN